jgi:hypothetical protein
MIIGCPADLTWYKLLTDLGSLIGGIFALFAGGALYAIGRRQVRVTKEAAEQQVAAANRQTEAVKQQNADIRQSDTRRLAREALITTRLFHGIITNVMESTTTGAIPDEVPLYEVIDHLGKLDPEIIDEYFLLSRKIRHWRSGPTIPERDEIRDIAKRVLGRLSDTQKV